MNLVTTAITLPYLGNGREESLHMLSIEAFHPSVFNMCLVKTMDVGLPLWGAKLESTVRNNRASPPSSLYGSSRGVETKQRMATFQRKTWLGSSGQGK